jgi:hypothetical protein
MTTRRRLWPSVAGLILLVTACGGSPAMPAPSVVPGTGVAITATAGPTCPVEEPGDPACAPRPVAGATVLILDGQGQTVATVVLDDTGSGSAALPPGDYVIEAQPANGLMGTPELVNATVISGALTRAELAYDTGIR